jgi:hypothetical protein
MCDLIQLNRKYETELPSLGVVDGNLSGPRVRAIPVSLQVVDV